MAALSDYVIQKFCDLCDWAHQSWLMRAHLFDANPERSCLDHPHHRMFFYRLSEITLDYFVQQLAKLHDPSVQSGQINLSINYIVEYGGWDAATKQLLQDLNQKMSPLAEKMKAARNKILCHNDLRTILTDVPQGIFTAGMDVEYFEYLQEFVNIIYATTTKGGPFPFEQQATLDVQGFLTRWKKGLVQ